MNSHISYSKHDLVDNGSSSDSRTYKNANDNGHYDDLISYAKPNK